MTIPYAIRQATPADNKLLAQIGWEAFDSAFAPFNTPEDMAAYLPSAFSPEIQAAELADPRNIFWIVNAGEEAAGYVKLFTGRPDRCISKARALQIARLYLLPRWHGQGIGQQLLHRALEYAREKAFEAIWLTVWEENKRALKLYQDFGFQIVGREDFILGQDVQNDFIMEKHIS